MLGMFWVYLVSVLVCVGAVLVRFSYFVLCFCVRGSMCWFALGAFNWFLVCASLLGVVLI